MALPKISENLQKRIISAAILAPVVLAIIFAGGVWFGALVIFAAVIMSFEWCGIINSGNVEITDEQKKKWQTSGILYIGIFASSLLYLRGLDSGFGIIMFALLTVWATDIAAYFSGRAIGGPKIMPSVSPNKTWAGLVGGMVAAGIVGVIASIFAFKVNIFGMFVFGCIVAVISQIGDFFESWVKRKFGVKDSGTIIPGHGGLMDRVDGLTTTMPLFAIICMLNSGNLF